MATCLMLSIMRSKLNISGVYTITSPSGGVYVGSAVLVRRRWHQHKITLRGQKHKNPTLQSAWNKYGEDQMKFALLLVCSRSDLLFFEQRAIDALKPRYNICPVAGTTTGGRWTDERRERARARMTGTKHSPESIAKMVAARTGRPCSEAAKEKIRAQRWTHSEEAKAKMRGPRKPKPQPRRDTDV